MNNFIPSEKQQAIFSFAAESKKSGIIIAVAGAGKTTTLIEMFKRIQETPTLMLAFNKTIADELKSRVPAHVQAATFHSVGFAAWNRYVGKKIAIDSGKVGQIMRDFMSPRDMAIYGSFVRKMVSLAKGAGMTCLIADTQAEWMRLQQHFAVEMDTEGAKVEYGIELAQKILRRSIEEAREVIDYDDMLFMPLIENVTFPKFPLVCIDEAQDTNGVQRALLKRMLEQPEGRLIAVGDPKQAIYGFRGADSSAMEMIRHEFDCVELPLTVSYRCPQAVVKHAQRIVSYIEAHPDAPQGSVTYNPGTTENGKFVAQTFRPNDAVICRNSAPLISMAYQLIGKRVSCHILGREIGKGLVDLVKKLNAAGIDALQAKLQDFETREVGKAIAKDQQAQAEAIRDKCECVRICINALVETKRTVPGLIASIEALFSDSSVGALTLCTVHKSKGLEWERVYILDADVYMPSKWARLPWQKDQEANLMYVAYTRAKLELCFITSEHVKTALQAVDVKPVDIEASTPTVARAPGQILEGDKVEVIKGRNVEIGTIGKVTKCFGEPYFGIVMVDARGTEHKTYAKNVKLVA